MTSKLRLTFGVRQSEAIEWAEKDESAKRFLSRYKNRSRNEYTRVLALFFNWLKIKKEIALSPTEFLNSQLRKSHSDKTQERRWGANLALEFVRDGEFSDASDTHRRLHWNVIKQFFDFNEVPFCSARNPLGGKSGRRKYKPKPLTREDAKRILGALNQRDCAVAIIMLQSGMSIGDVLRKFNFMLEYIQAQIRAGAERIKIEFDERKGNGFSYFTYISADGIQELRKWLIIRERWIREHNLKLSGEAQKAIFINKKGKVLTPMKYERNFECQLYAKKVKKAPFQITTHQLRKIFKTESSPPERNISDKVVEFMMGHIEGLEAVGGTL